MEIPFEFGECRLRSMKEEDVSKSKKTIAIADYDSDETVVDDSTPGSDEEEDELCLKRMFPKVDIPPTSDVSVCPKKISVGEQSPEIHVIPKLDSAALKGNMKTATRQESENLSEEEASQSLLRNWERNLKSGVPPLKEDCPCHAPMDDTGQFEDSQQLFDSLEEEMQNYSVIESQEAQSLRPTIIDVSYPEKQTVLVDNAKVCVHKEDPNVSKTKKDESFPDDMVIGELLQVSSAPDSFADIIDDLSFLEMSEDGSGELNAMVLAAINSMQNPQPAKNGPNTERDQGQVNSEFNSDHTQIPDSVFTDESGEYKKLENGLYIQKTDKMQTCSADKSKEAQSLLPAITAIDVSYPEKETVLVDNVKECVQNKDLNNILEEKFVAEERNIDPPLLINNGSCSPSICSHLGNVEEKSVRQKSPQHFQKESILTKSDCKNVSWNDASCSQASMSPLEQIKPAGEVSKTAVCNKGVRKSPIISNNVSNLKESITSQHQENVQEKKSEENTKDTEIILRKSARLQNKRERCGKRKCSIDPAHRIEISKKNNSTPPVLCESTLLNNTESVQYSTASKTIRKTHKRDFMGETLLHKACRKRDLEPVKCLIEAGINVNQKDNAGWAAIHEASCKGNTEVILALIQAGANVNCKGLDGITPLHDAVYCNHFENMDALLPIILLWQNEQIRNNRTTSRRLRRRRTKAFKNRLTLDSFSDDEVKQHFRISKEAISEIYSKIYARIDSTTTRSHAIPGITKLLSVLHFLASGSFQYCIGGKLGLSQSNFSRILRPVVNAIISLAGEYIRFPQSEREQNSIVAQFYEKAGFPAVLGLIDCTHVAFIPPSADEDIYRNRKMYHSLNIQIICGPKMEIMDVVAKFPGSNHDSFILANSRIGDLFENGQYGDRLLLGDNGYGLKYWMMTPYLAPNTAAQRNYNKAHKKTRSLIERVFGMLKSRFRCLDVTGGAMLYSPELLAKIVVCCCILHNVAMNHQIPVEVTEDIMAENDSLWNLNLSSTTRGRQRQLHITQSFFGP